MSSYFLVFDGEYVARCHVCPDEEKAAYAQSPEDKMEVSKALFDHITSGRGGRYKYVNGEFIFCADADNPAIMEAQVRGRREYLLKESDWTQLPDVPLATKEAWAVYRQALRDITSQPGFPMNIEWPVAP